MQVLIWDLKCLLSMLRCMLGSVKGVKGENPKASQAGSQAVTSQAGTLLLPEEGSNLAASQAGSQAVTSQAGSQAVTSQAGTLLLPEEGSNLAAAQATQAGRQALTLAWGRRQCSGISGRQSGSYFPGRCSPSP